MVINLIDWIRISRTFLESNFKTIKRVEVMGKKLQHDPEKTNHNFSSYQLCGTEKLLSCKDLYFLSPFKRLKFENYLSPFELLNRL